MNKLKCCVCNDTLVYIIDDVYDPNTGSIVKSHVVYCDNDHIQCPEPSSHIWNNHECGCQNCINCSAIFYSLDCIIHKDYKFSN